MCPRPTATIPAFATLHDTLTHWQAEFLIDREAARCTPKTLQFYQYTIGHLCAFIQTADNLTPTTLRAWLVSLQSRGWADTTIHMHARAAKTFCGWLYAEGYIPVNPWARVPMPKVAKKILPALSTDDVKRLLAFARCDRDKAIVLCLLDTGCRASEFCALTVGDVDMKSGMVRIREGKGRKDRVTRMGAKARKALLKYLRTRDGLTASSRLFESKLGNVLTPNSLLLLLNRIGQAAGVEHCSPHAFRRSFALWSYRQGMSLTDIQMMLGHSDLTVIRQYLDLNGRDLESAHRRFGPVDGML
jgi:site-specific recombinase XerD